MSAPEGIADDERLRRRAVTGAALSHSAVAGPLDQLLERVTDLLGADTAAILLLDVHTRQLVATAARGLEEEVRQGVRVPVGQGFAGRVAHTARPVIITDVTSRDVVSPILLDQGVRSLMGVPVLADGEVVGVLHVGSRTPRVFTADDAHRLQLAADRSGLAGRIRSHTTDQSAALALQRSLLPSSLPRIPGVDMAARYVPGHAYGLGGDWYDVFSLPSGWLGVVIGDVAGHGLQAAVVMGRVRSALRAYALVCDDPAEVLTLLDRKVHHFETGVLTTALYAMVSPDRTTVRLSSAGHPPPILAGPGSPVRVLDLPADPPLGIGRPSVGRRATTVAFPPGGVFACYTDGLVEQRHEVIDDGIARLARSVSLDDAEAVCDAVMTGSANERPTDDIALLVVRRLPGAGSAGSAPAAS